MVSAAAVTVAEVAATVAPIATVVGTTVGVATGIATAVEEHKQSSELEAQTEAIQKGESETEVTRRHEVDLERSLAHRRAVQDALLRAQSYEQMSNRYVRETRSLDPYSMSLLSAPATVSAGRHDFLKMNQDFLSSHGRIF